MLMLLSKLNCGITKKHFIIIQVKFSPKTLDWIHRIHIVLFTINISYTIKNCCHLHKPIVKILQKFTGKSFKVVKYLYKYY